MGMLNIDEHLEEHKQIAIRYPNRTVVEATVDPVSGAAIQTLWTGTQVQYDAIAVKDSNTMYVVV